MKTPKHPLTADERLAIECLHQVRFPVCSWDKRFFRDALCRAEVTGEIGEKSRPQLWRIFVRYWRQIHHPERDRLLKVARELSAPDFRKQQAAARAQSRIDEMRAKYAQAMKGREFTEGNEGNEGVRTGQTAEVMG